MTILSRINYVVENVYSANYRWIYDPESGITYLSTSIYSSCSVKIVLHTLCYAPDSPLSIDILFVIFESLQRKIFVFLIDSYGDNLGILSLLSINHREYICV